MFWTTGPWRSSTVWFPPPRSVSSAWMEPSSFLTLSKFYVLVSLVDVCTDLLEQTWSPTCTIACDIGCWVAVLTPRLSCSHTTYSHFFNLSWLTEHKRMESSGHTSEFQDISLFIICRSNNSLIMCCSPPALIHRSSFDILPPFLVCPMMTSQALQL